MNPILLALAASVLFGLNMALIKMAIHRKPFVLNAIITFFTAAVVIWIFVLFGNANLPAISSLPYFVLAGILAPGLSAILNFESLKRAGVSITSSLLATAPLFSTVFAVYFLKERINLLIGFGTLSIILGIVLLSWFRPKKHIKLADLLLPLTAALLIGIGAVSSKFGLNISNLPLGGIAIAVTAGVITQFIFITALGKWHTISKNAYDLKYFVIAGIFVGIALISLFFALSLGDVVVIFPLSNTQTLFAILFSWLLFKEHDHITRHTLIGAAAIIIGASLISIGA
ncbi:DMT family transporter [Candidatus Woesearchaeota archaeon]|nr:DMT family transporter [Candidatus Woesearchaeota archaeon]